MLSKQRSVKLCRFAILFFFLSLFFLSPVATPAASLDINISITVPGTTTTPPVAGGGGGGGVKPTTGTVVLSGYGYPGAILTYIRNGIVVGTEIVKSDGRFERMFKVPSSEISVFGLWTRDRYGLISPTVNITLEVVTDSITRIDNIALPPTITYERAAQNNLLVLYGSAFPGSVVRLFNNLAPAAQPFEIIAGPDGIWSFPLSPRSIGENYFSYKANYQIESVGIISPFSSTLEIKQVMCRGSDFNFDGKVNLTDLSILLYYWGGSPPKDIAGNPCVDRNQDGIVDVRDFSIVLYDWSEK
ncbi:MAG: dockerin type I repeat-containing protein [bacterium]|nr:dockerin type I repeat-containing protein [bacterium]